MDSLWVEHGSAFSQSSVSINENWSAWGALPPEDALHRLSGAFQPVVGSADGRMRVAFRFQSASVADDHAILRMDVHVADTDMIIDVSRRVFSEQLGQVSLLRFVSAILVIAKACALCEHPRGQFTIGVGDDASDEDLGPCAAGHRTLLVPDPYYIGSAGYSDFRGQVDRAWLDWQDREPVVFWRGSTTGRTRPPEAQTYDPFCIVQRTEMCARLRRGRHRDRCDVGISGVVQLPPSPTVDRIQAELSSPRVERIAQMKARYIIDIDGNTNSWGLIEGFLMGACVIKVESSTGHHQWYYDRLRRGSNYLSVAADLTDLEAVIDWAFANPAACAQIAARGRELALSLTFDDTLRRAAETVADRFLKSPT